MAETLLDVGADATTCVVCRRPAPADDEGSAIVRTRTRAAVDIDGWHPLLAQLDAQQKQGEWLATPLRLAILSSRAHLSDTPPLLATLCQHGGAVDFVGSDGLRFAVIIAHEPAAAALLALGVQIDKHLPPGTEPLFISAIRAGGSRALLERLVGGQDINELRDNAGFSPLHIAAASRNLDALRLLLPQPGLDVNCLGRVAATPLHVALDPRLCLGMGEGTGVAEGESVRAVNVVAELVRAGADVNASILKEWGEVTGQEEDLLGNHSDCSSVLHIALRVGAPERSVRMLLGSGAELAAEDANGDIPSDVCSDRHLLSIIRRCFENHQMQRVWWGDATSGRNQRGKCDSCGHNALQHWRFKRHRLCTECGVLAHKECVINAPFCRGPWQMQRDDFGQPNFVHSKTKETQRVHPATVLSIARYAGDVTATALQQNASWKGSTPRGDGGGTKPCCIL